MAVGESAFSRFTLWLNRQDQQKSGKLGIRRASCDRKRRCVLHAYFAGQLSLRLYAVRHKVFARIFAPRTASALLTKCNSLPTPRFRPTCGRRYRTRFGDRHDKRDRLNNTNNNPIRRMAKEIPARTTARNFEAPSSSDQP
jgi:hypothetical protein